MQTVFGILRLLLCLIGGVLMDMTVNRILPRKQGRLYRAIVILLFGFLLAMPSWIGDENTLFFLPFFIIGFLLCYTGRWYARLTVCFAFFALTLPLNMMIDSLLPNVLPFSNYQLFLSAAKLLLCGCFFLLSVRLIPKEMRPLTSAKLWWLLGGLSLAPFISTIALSLWDTITSDDYAIFTERLGITILPFVVLSAFAMLAAIIVLSRHEELVERQKLAEIQAVYYKGLQAEQAEVRKIRHDMRNHITTAGNFLAAGDADAAKRYLANLADTEALTAARQICENSVANAVLSGKMETIENEGMTADFIVSLPKELPLTDIDLCALLGNALDNAIEAARAAEDKKISVRARTDKGVFMLKAENATGTPPRVEKDGSFQSTKKDTTAHGLGLKSMRDIARRYGGGLEAKAENGRFELVVWLPCELGS